MQLILTSQLQSVDPACERVNELLTTQGLEKFHFPVELVLRELLNNAILHGNRQQPDKRVTLEVRVGWRWIKLRVQDQGSGFNWRQTRRLPPNIEATSGRGMAITRLYAQRLHFSDGGRQVEVWFDQQHSEPRNHIQDVE
ncbi:MAG: ATP-binding protein [Desulfuromonadales bacterium]|nr:ATP-binding protein [Desulfuromonadales bacterium]MBN2791567.1 ATP-binding protein [Desulfuromonadales bacterium]